MTSVLEYKNRYNLFAMFVKYNVYLVNCVIAHSAPRHFPLESGKWMVFKIERNISHNIKIILSYTVEGQ